MKALVTGGSRGIGRAVAKALHARGAQLCVSGRDAAALATLASELPGCTTIAGDLNDASFVDALVDRAAAALSGLDALVGCAGVVRYAAARDVTLPELAEQLQVNFVAPLVLTQRAAARMAQAGQGGAIVHVASNLGVRPVPYTAAYAASKAALISMTRSFAHELGPLGIRVNAVAPGVVDTDMIRAARGAGSEADHATAAQLERLRALHPLGRLGTTEDIAEAVLYLLDAHFVSGTVLVVDGGLLARA